MTTLDNVMHEINSLINNNDFPLEVIKDVNLRLNDSSEVGYAKQQLRYLKNYKNIVLDENKTTEEGK